MQPPEFSYSSFIVKVYFIGNTKLTFADAAPILREDVSCALPAGVAAPHASSSALLPSELTLPDTPSFQLQFATQYMQPKF